MTHKPRAKLCRRARCVLESVSCMNLTCSVLLKSMKNADANTRDAGRSLRNACVVGVGLSRGCACTSVAERLVALSTSAHR